MKKLILIAMLFASCKKDYTCMCRGISGVSEPKTIQARNDKAAKFKCERTDYLSFEMCKLK